MAFKTIKRDELLAQTLRVLAAQAQTSGSELWPNVTQRATAGLRLLDQRLRPRAYRYEGAVARLASPLEPDDGDGWLRVRLPADGSGAPVVLAGRFFLQASVGHGALSQIFSADDLGRPGGPRVALKVLNARLAAIGLQEEARLRAVAARDGLGVAPLMPLLARVRVRSHVCLAMPLAQPLLPPTAPAGARGVRVQTLGHLRHVAARLLAGLAFLHRSGLVHADVKLDNVLVLSASDDPAALPDVRLADLGNCIPLSQLHVYEDDFKVATLSHRAPEALLGVAPLGPPLDLWALGCVLVELALGYPLFFGGASPPRPVAADPEQVARVELLQQMVARLGPLPPTLAHGKLAASAAGLFGANGGDGQGLAALLAGAGGAALTTFVGGLLRFEPARRLTAAAALCHPFFAPLFPFACVFADAPARAYPVLGRGPSPLHSLPLLTTNPFLDAQYDQTAASSAASAPTSTPLSADTASANSITPEAETRPSLKRLRLQAGTQGTANGRALTDYHVAGVAARNGDDEDDIVLL